MIRRSVLLLLGTSPMCLAATPHAASQALVNSAQLLTDARHAALQGSPGASVLVSDYPAARLITLNKPAALNSTDLGMQTLLRRYLVEERHPQDAGSPSWDAAFVQTTGRATPNTAPHSEEKTGCVYILQGAGGRSFCAGGDVVAMIKDEPAGTQFASTYLEYQLDYYLWSATHNAGHAASEAHQQRRNTFVSLWNGYVMGGGVGLSLHGHIRVAAPNTVFAMPECTIGFFPDVGASYFLPRLDIPSEYNTSSSERTRQCDVAGRCFPGMGLYLGLTAARLKGADLIHTGIATHMLPDAALFPKLTEALCGVKHPAEVDDVLSKFCVPEEHILSSSPPYHVPPAMLSTSPMHSKDSSDNAYAFSLAPEHLAVLAECFTLHPEAVRLYNAHDSHDSHDGSLPSSDAPGDEGALNQKKKKRRSRLGGPITPVESVEDVISRLQAVHTRETSTSVNPHGNRKAAVFAERLLAQLWPALTGESYIRGPRAAKECDGDEDDAAAQESYDGDADDKTNGATKASVSTAQQRKKQEAPLPPLSPTSLKLAFDMQRRSIEEKDLGPALAREYAACIHACGEVPYRDARDEHEDGGSPNTATKASANTAQNATSKPSSTKPDANHHNNHHKRHSRLQGHTDFVEGVAALLIRKGKTPPVWSPSTLPLVHDDTVEAFYVPKTRHGLRQPVWDPYTPFESHTLV